MIFSRFDPSGLLPNFEENRLLRFTVLTLLSLVTLIGTPVMVGAMGFYVPKRQPLQAFMCRVHMLLKGRGTTARLLWIHEIMKRKGL